VELYHLPDIPQQRVGQTAPQKIQRAFGLSRSKQQEEQDLVNGAFPDGVFHFLSSTHRE
jgi:hypothetical protein